MRTYHRSGPVDRVLTITQYCESLHTRGRGNQLSHKFKLCSFVGIFSREMRDLRPILRTLTRANRGYICM